MSLSVPSGLCWCARVSSQQEPWVHGSAQPCASNVTLGAGNQPVQGCLHHRNWDMLQPGSLSPHFDICSPFPDLQMIGWYVTTGLHTLALPCCRISHQGCSFCTPPPNSTAHLMVAWRTCFSTDSGLVGTDMEPKCLNFNCCYCWAANQPL